MGPNELQYRVTEHCHHFHPNLDMGYLDIFGEGMGKDSRLGLHMKGNPLSKVGGFNFQSDFLMKITNKICFCEELSVIKVESNILRNFKKTASWAQGGVLSLGVFGGDRASTDGGGGHGASTASSGGMTLHSVVVVLHLLVVTGLLLHLLGPILWT